MIEFRDVHASYDGSAPILKGVSFTIRDGEFVAFVGTNGAGKSTTMRLMNGLLKPDAGQVLIDGVPTSDLRTSELARRVGFLFQNPDSQICCNTVREELLFGFKALGLDGPDADSRVDAIVEEFAFDPDDDPFLLNRGARQLLALASIVVLAPPVVVLDEPTTGLDVLRNRETLERASLVPPQIVELSLELGREMPHLADGPVGRANTLDEMAAAVMEEVRTSERSVCA